MQAPLTRQAIYQSFIFIVLRVSPRELVRSIGFTITGLRFQAWRSQVSLIRLPSQVIRPLLNLIRFYLVNYSRGFIKNLASYSSVSLVSVKVQSAKKRVLSIQSLIIPRPFNQVYRRQGLQVKLRGQPYKDVPTQVGIRLYIGLRDILQVKGYGFALLQAGRKYKYNPLANLLNYR